MPNTLSLLRKPRLWLLLSLLSSADVTIGETEISGAVSIGREYDSNVAIDELDQSSNKGDRATLLGADVALKQDVTEDTAASLSYGYSGVNYDNFDTLSRQTHMLGFNLSTDWSAATSGLNYFYIRALLDGEDFLTYQRISPSLSGFVSKRWFLRGAYVYGQKDVTSRQGRSAKNHGGEVDAYFFWQGLRRYINLGYSYRNEDSEAARFDYSGHQIKLRLVQRFDIFGELTTFELGMRYEVRDYSSPTPSISAERDDDRLRLKAELEIPLGSHLQWSVYTSYSDYSSNLPSADYQQTLVGTRIELSF